MAVYQQSGTPLSEWQKSKGQGLVGKARVVLLDWESEVLRQRITDRVEAMWNQGWPEEVRGLLKVEGWWKSQSSRALGYELMVEYLEGRIHKEECLEKIRVATWQYARRQRSWYRRESGIADILRNRSDIDKWRKVQILE
ncbi:MAG: hypothetical protein HC904_08155 [Blastochloris sp.]|nr:hypothetical protein [Blastochloris sp.]